MQIETRKIEGGIAEKTTCMYCIYFRDVRMEVEYRQYVLMGGEVGNETYVGLLVASSASLDRFSRESGSTI